MTVTVNIYITSAGTTRAFLLRDEEGIYPEVIGVGRTLPSAIRDYADCFNGRPSRPGEQDSTTISPSDILPSRRVVQRFPEIWHLCGCECGK